MKKSTESNQGSEVQKIPRYIGTAVVEPFTLDWNMIDPKTGKNVHRDIDIEGKLKVIHKCIDDSILVHVKGGYEVFIPFGKYRRFELSEKFVG